MGAIGGYMRAIQSGRKPNFERLRMVKNQGIEDANVNLLKDWNDSRTASGKSLADWTAEYVKTNPVQMKQEVGAIDRYYTGDMDRILAANRARRAQAMRDATDRAMAYGTRRSNAAMLGGGMGGDSSYNRRLAMATNADLLAKEAIDAASQERADLADMERARLGLIGKRAEIGQSSMLPARLQAEMLANNTRGLAGISSIDLANTDYGLWNKPGLYDQAAMAMDAHDQGVMNFIDMYSSMGGGMGGGMGGMARGGPFMRGLSFVAGEEGPEVIVPTRNNPGPRNRFSYEMGGSFGIPAPMGDSSSGGFWQGGFGNGADEYWASWEDEMYGPGSTAGSPQPPRREMSPRSERSIESKMGFTKVPEQFLPSWSSGGAQAAQAMAQLAASYDQKGLPGYAEGGVFTGETPMIVGENGPEVITPTAPGFVVPNDQLQSFALTGTAVAPAPRKRTIFSNFSDADLMKAGRMLSMAKAL